MRLENGQEITSLREAQAIMSSAFPEFLRKASFDWVVRGWEKFQTTYQNIYHLYPDFVDTEKTFYERAGMQELPPKDENMPYAAVGIATTALLTFKPIKRGGIIEITDEMIKWDKSGQIQNFAVDFGVAAKRTMEKAAWDLMITPPGASTPTFNQASVYQNASSAAAPWINANNLLFSGDNLTLTLLAMRRQKDVQGNLLNIMPDTMIVPLEGENAAHQILESDWLGFTSGNDHLGLAGPGTFNVYKNKLSADRVFTSPFFQSSSGTAYTTASFPWAVFEIQNQQAFTILEVEPFDVLHEEPQAAASVYFERDAVRLRGRLWNCPALEQPRAVYYQTPVF